MSAKYVIGVDGGTESLRAGVFDLHGKPLAFASHPYKTQYPRPGWAEQDPADWWHALGVATKQAVAESGVSPGQIVALSATTTCCTVVALDEAGDALRPALLWMDMRSGPQAAEVCATGDVALKVNGGGAGPVSAEWMVPKALWLMRNEPQVFEAAATICEYQDYINHKLTGHMVASLNNASVRWHYNAATGWPTSLLQKLGLSALAEKWPSTVLPLGAPVGKLTAAAAAHLGLDEGTLVAQGGADAFVGMLGLGVVEDGQLALLTGSSHLQLGMSAKPIHGAGLFGTYTDAVLPGLCVIEGGQTSTGSICNWFKNRIMGEASSSYDALNAGAAELPPGAEGLTCLDHFQGNRTPHTDPLSRGAIVGLSLRHGPEHIHRALMESVCFGTALVLENMRRHGYCPQIIAIAGGITKSELWLQMHADVCNLPFQLTRVTDAPALGCAILAAAAAGLHPDIPAAVKAMVHVDRVVQPNPEAHAAYQDPYERYKQLYPALSPIFHTNSDHPPPQSKQHRQHQQTSQASGPPEAANGHEKEAATPSPPPAAAAVATAPSPAAAPAAAAAAAPPAPAAAAAAPAPAPPPAAAATSPAAPMAGGPNPPAPSPSRPIIISPSILAADFANLQRDVGAALAGGAQWVHVDMFDGSFVDNFTMGFPVVASLRKAFPDAFLDCHLAVNEPAKYITHLAQAGASGATFQIEPLGSWQEAAELAACIREAGMKANVALAPETGVDVILPLVEQGCVDMVLCMTVACGFGGQKFQPGVLTKVQQLRSSFPTLDIQVDGGINMDTAVQAVRAGANVLVAGSAVFGAKKGGPAAGVVAIASAALAAAREAMDGSTGADI